jgi:hypothetical protein
VDFRFAEENASNAKLPLIGGAGVEHCLDDRDIAGAAAQIPG